MIAIIGGGFAGIYALKYCIQEGLSCKLFESSDDIGGVWKYRPNCDGGFLENGHTSSSIHFLHPSDFPFPDNTPQFPHHSVVFNHLKKYVEYFKLSKYIYLNTPIDSVVKKSGKWIVSYKNKKQTFEKVIIATGIHTIPAEIPEIYKSFSGEVIHSHYYEKNKEKFVGKKVLIIGGGETSNDMCDELAPKCDLYMSIRNGQWFQGKWVGAGEPADLYFNRYMMYTWYPPLRNLVGFMNSFIWGKGGTGVPEWEPSVPYNQSFLTKGRECINWISKGKLTPCSGVTHIEGGTVYFKDKKIKPDIILLCTGYTNKHLKTLLPNGEGDLDAFKLIFNPNDISLSFCGFVRPTLGSLPMLAELQARLISKVYSEKVHLPSNMKKVIEEDNQWRDTQLKISSSRLKYLVYYYLYCDQIAKLLGCKPNMFKLFFSDFILWARLFFDPWIHFHYNIDSKDERTRSIARHMIEKIGGWKLRFCAFSATLLFLFVFFILFLLIKLVFF